VIKYGHVSALKLLRFAAADRNGNTKVRSI
jgi:hypothetical protein